MKSALMPAIWPDRPSVDAAYVESRLAELSKNEDLSRYIL
jgi:ATP-dependent protease HslVU (ClpYQ) ATPase subunit